MSPFLSWRPLVGSLRACSSAELAALRCIAAARNGFLLAALHSVAKRVSRGQAYHPTRSRPRLARRPPRTPPPPRSAAPFPLGRAIAACPLEWNRSQESVFWFWLSPRNSRLFSQPRSMGTCCAREHAGTVRCRWARLPRVDPLCDRMERGEEEGNTGRRDASQRRQFCGRQGP